MPQILRHDQHRSYFILYCGSMILHGINLIGIGSYIPYLTAETGVVETQYSFVFSCRSFGMLLGAFIIKMLQKQNYANHTLLIAGTSIITVFTCVFTLTHNSFWLGTWMFLASTGYCVFEVVLNVCFLLISPPEEAQYWMLIGHGAFGVGGILSPILVYIFELKAYLVFGGLIFLLIPLLLKMKSPEQCGFIPQHKTSPALKARSISTNMEICLCLLIFIYVGVETSFGGWIPSFAVLTSVTDNAGATRFPSLFWVLLTMFRFLLAFAPGTSTRKLKILIEGIFYSGIVSLVVVYAGHIELACYLGAVFFGLTMSSVYPLVFTYPIQAGLVIEDSQITNIGIAGVVSEGVLTMIVGKLMEWIHVYMLFYSICLFTLAMWLIRLYSLELIDKQKRSMEEGGIATELLPKIKNLE